MKQVRKLFALALSLVLLLALATPAMAEQTTYTITINNTANDHIYEAYQVFTGDLAEDGTLSNVVWGSGITENGKTALQNKYDDEAEEKSAAGVADALTLSNVEEFAKDAAQYLGGTYATSVRVEEKETDNGTEPAHYTITVSAPGYYLIKDKNGTLTNINDAHTAYILKVAGDAEVTPKSDVPESEKKVDDKNDSNTTEDTVSWQDSADYDIGDAVPYKITAKLPDNVSAYTGGYTLSFVDTMSKGLTYVNGSAEVFVNGNSAGKLDLIPTAVGETNDQYNGGTILTWNLGDITKAPYNAGDNAEITITYSAELNRNAVIGSNGNPNKMHIVFSNNPYDSGTGVTPDDTNIVFTYKVVINKVRKNPEYISEEKTPGEEEYIALTGAAFKLEKQLQDGSWELVEQFDVDETTTSFEFRGLDDGTYKLTETAHPAGYNSIDPIEFTVTATHEIESDDPSLTELKGDKVTGEIIFTRKNTDEDALSADVVNQAGATLPSTGGIGTTIFYILGAVLALGAVVLLVAKKRMSAER